MIMSWISYKFLIRMVEGVGIEKSYVSLHVNEDFIIFLLKLGLETSKTSLQCISQFSEPLNYINTPCFYLILIAFLA